MTLSIIELVTEVFVEQPLACPGLLNVHDHLTDQGLISRTSGDVGRRARSRHENGLMFESSLSCTTRKVLHGGSLATGLAYVNFCIVFCLKTLQIRGITFFNCYFLV